MYDYRLLRSGRANLKHCSVQYACSRSRSVMRNCGRPVHAAAVELPPDVAQQTLSNVLAAVAREARSLVTLDGVNVTLDGAKPDVTHGGLYIAVASDPLVAWTGDVCADRFRSVLSSLSDSVSLESFSSVKSLR